MITFVDNTGRELGYEIACRLQAAQWAFFTVAFIRESGVDTMEAAIRAFIARGGKLFVLFGNAFGITEANAVRRLQALGAELRYHRGADTFHAKGYLFGTSAVNSAIVGSSNLSRSGLRGGVEWNVVIESGDWDLTPIVNAAKQLWESRDSMPVTEVVLAELGRDARQVEPSSHHQDDTPKPSAPMPREAAVEFPFRLNHSFLNYPSHPITIPIQFNTLVRTHGLDSDDVRIHAPDGQQFEGRVSEGNNNQGEYHQIRVNGRDDDALSQLPRGEEITVRISKGQRGVEVHLLRRA